MVEVVQVAPHRTHKCIECRAMLKYHYVDVNRAYSNALDDMRSTIKCPECDTTLDVQSWQEEDTDESKD